VLLRFVELLMAITRDLRFTDETRKNSDSEQAIDESKLKPSFIMSHSTKVMSAR